jgi:AcrR family transcriptional regulator
MAKAQPQAQSSTLTAEDWVEAAFDMLAAGGIDAVRIEPLARTLNVTRGSFYWHFADRDALYEAMLKRWRKRSSYAVYTRLEREAESAEARLERLLDLPYSGARASRAAAIELAIRLWARRDSRAEDAVQKIDRIRLDYYAKLMVERGYAPKAARQQAFLFYAALMAEALIRVDNAEQVRADLRATLLAGPAA